jgi:signal transduction histidine kinase
MNQSQSATRLVTKIYSHLLFITFALIPLSGIAYLFLFQNPPMRFENHGFHEIAISVAILESAFISYVTWQCYRQSGEPFLRWLTLGFLGFTLVYAPHGIFTAYSHHNLWLFLLYGPASRLVMAGCFLRALFIYGKPPENEDIRARRAYWWRYAGVFLLIDVVVAGIASSPLAGAPPVRLSMEIGALCLSLLAILIMVMRRIRSPLMTIFYGLSLACFAQSSLAFVLTRAWTHLWWLAHAIFATGFFVLSYGVIKAFLSTRAFATVYSQEELMERALAANIRTQETLTNLQNAHIALAQKAEELTLSNALLDRATKELEHANIDLEAFASSIAHDLRAPIRAIDGFSKILLDDFSSHLASDAREYLTDIRQCAREMGQMVQDLLNLARLQYQEMTVETVRLSDLLEGVLRDLKADLSNRDVEWQIDTLPEVNCDPGLIRQVFANLLSNAVKFTRDRKPAAIQVGQVIGENEFIIFVRDNGIGFDPKLTDKLFGIFTRLHDAKDFEGNGVGLATVRRVVQKHGGRIWAETQPGRGATFYFSLPKIRQPSLEHDYPIGGKIEEIVPVSKAR